MYSVKATYLFIGKAVEHSYQKPLQSSHIRTTMSRQIPKKDIYGISHNIQYKSIIKNHPKWVHCDYFDRQWFKKKEKEKVISVFAVLSVAHSFHFDCDSALGTPADVI